MARNGFLRITILIILLAISLQHVFAIKCWICTSEVDFCNDPFDESNIDDSQKRWSYIECTPPPPNQFDRRAVCKKVVQTVNDNSIISRSCFWENIYAPSDECMSTLNQNVPSAIKTEFCETCSDDGCNSSQKHGATGLLVIISAFVSKIYLF